MLFVCTQFVYEYKFRKVQDVLDCQAKYGIEGISRTQAVFLNILPLEVFFQVITKENYFCEQILNDSLLTF